MSPSRALTRIYHKLYAFYGPQSWWPAKTRFEVIIGAILTQNTAWSNVEKAITNLKKARALSPSKIRDIPVKTLAKLLKPSGYYNIKAKRLKNFVDFLFARHGESLRVLSKTGTEALRRELLAVNGIGPETCDSILLYAFSRPVFVIDAYTKRIFSRHKFLSSGADYHEAQEFFMKNLPPDEKLFNEYHALIVAAAKEFCRTRPKCGRCPLKLVENIYI